MTAADFAARHPKPWRWVINVTTMALKDACGKTIGTLALGNHRAGMPQKEWNRHIANVLGEKMPVLEAQRETDIRRALIEGRSPWPSSVESAEPPPAKERPPAERIDSASPSPESTAGAQSPRGSGKE